MAGASSRGRPLAGSLDKVSIKCAESFVQTLTIARIVACRVKDDMALYEVQWNNSWLCAQMLKDIFDGAASLIQGLSLPNENTAIQNGDIVVEQQQCGQQQQYRILQQGQQEHEQQPQPQIRLQEEQQQEQHLQQQVQLQKSEVDEAAVSFPLKAEVCEDDYDRGLGAGRTGTIYICDVCSDGFPTSTSLQSHKQEHHGISSTMYSASFNLSVNTISQQNHPPTMIPREHFIPHESNSVIGGGGSGSDGSAALPPHVIDMFECDVCRMTFADEEYLRRHKVRCKDQSASEFRCSWCGRGFTTKGSLELHVSAVHLKKKDFGCSICGKLFSRKHILKIHLATHYGERNFECETCGKTFVQKSNYNRHVRIHEAKNFGYKCRYCGQAFTQNKHVEKHVLAYHTDIKEETDTSPKKTIAVSEHPPL